MNHQKHVCALVSRCLDTAREMGYIIDESSVFLGDAECEPYYSVVVADEYHVVEGDYAAGTVRLRTINGKGLLEVNALAPLALSLEAFMSWGRAREWTPPTPRDDHGRDDDETTPAPLDGPISRFVFTVGLGLAGVLDLFEPVAALAA